MGLHRFFIKAVAAAIIGCISMLYADAHELESNRATLVLRERNHISITLVINLTDLLFDVLAPEMPIDKFLSHFAAMPTPEFRQKLQVVQSLVQADTSMMLPNGKVLALTQWRWPKVEIVQENLRESAMQMAVDPHAHVVETPVEVHAEVTSNEDLSLVGFSPAKALESVLVVYYRPKQSWVTKESHTLQIRF